MKTFVSDTVNSFNVGPDDVRVGVMSFSSSYQFHFHLDTFSSKSDILSAITSIPYNGGGTNTAYALDAVRTIGFTESTGARSKSKGVPRIAIVVTDGYSNNYQQTILAAYDMHDAGIIGFAVGIAGANQNELAAIASEPLYVAFISSFDLTLLKNLQVTLSQEACVGKLNTHIHSGVYMLLMLFL